MKADDFAGSGGWVETFEVNLGVKSGSKSAVEAGDGARYWMAFGRFRGY